MRFPLLRILRTRRHVRPSPVECDRLYEHRAQATLRCNILIRSHIPVHIKNMHRLNTHLCMPLGLHSIRYSMYCATTGNIQEWCKCIHLHMWVTACYTGVVYIFYTAVWYPNYSIAIFIIISLHIRRMWETICDAQAGFCTVDLKQ